MTNKSVLGRGLSSLIPNKKEKTSQSQKPKIEKKEENVLDNKDKIKFVSVDNIVPNTQQPRQFFGHHEMEELIKSIEEHGILQPIVVCPIFEGKYEIIMGERRWRSAKVLGLKTIPAVIRGENIEEQKKLELAIIENIHRKDLSSVEEAESYNKLITDFNLTQEEVAKKVGKNRSTIANFLRLLDLPQEIRRGITEEKITMGHAKSILSLNSPAKQLELYKKIILHKLSVREVEKLVSKHKKNSVSQNTNNSSVNNYLHSMERLLCDNLKTKVKIDKLSNGNGKIVISFYSDDELRNLITLINE